MNQSWKTCPICDHLVRRLSPRGWCSVCELEFKQLKDAMRRGPFKFVKRPEAERVSHAD